VAQDDVIIVGAGLSGMTAGVYLSEAGKRVRVFEANKVIGGRTSSWTAADGMAMESGLHRFLGFYTALPDVLQKVDVALDDILAWEDEVEIRSSDDTQAVMGLAPLHKPLKTLDAVFGNNDFLSPADKLSIMKMMAAGAKDYVANPKELDRITVLKYAEAHGVTEAAMQRVLVPMTEGIFFMPMDRYSMFNLMGLAMPYLGTLPKLRVGAFKGGMTEVMMQPMADFITKGGGEVLVDSPVERLLVEDGGVRGVVVRGREYRARHVILATSLRPAQDLLRADFAKRPSLAGFFKLKTMPAVTFQLELKAPSMEVDRTTFGPGTPLASFAEQSRTTFRAAKGRLSVILSPPTKYIDMSDDKLLEVVLDAGERLGLKLRDNVQRYHSVRLPQDFYSLEPGSERLRPEQATDIYGLTLAGDYTKQPNLATMEGAVVAGKNAAQNILSQEEYEKNNHRSI
jgi:15-cis-phytoene desaturase